MWSATAIILVPVESEVMAGMTGLLLCGLGAGAVAVSSVNLEVFMDFLTNLSPVVIRLVNLSLFYPSCFGGHSG